jgi:hypothetical protein
MPGCVLKTGSATTEIVGKVLYRLKDVEAYEEACLVRKLF